MEPEPAGPPPLQDAEATVVGVASTWRAAGERGQAGAQTEAIARRESGVQAGGSAEAGTQTAGAAHAAAGGTGGLGAADPAALLRLFGEVLPLVEEALRENVTSTAFSVPEQLLDDREASVEATETLRPFPQGNAHGLVCTGLSWSATGMVLAASFGRYDISGWCEFPGALATWNLGARGGAREGHPEHVLETAACLMCCKFHPQHPALVAGGAYSGELYVWDLSREGDTQVGKSSITDVSHSEPVVQIAWHHDSARAGRRANQNEDYHVVTLGADGKVLIWSIAGALDRPIFGYQLLHLHGETLKMVLWGGACLAFRERSFGRQDGAFLVGSDTGSVFRCFLDYNERALEQFAEAAGGPKPPKLNSPIKAEHLGHDGPVHAIQWSPHERNLFLTAGADSMIRIYSTLKAQPLMALEPTRVALLAAQWSPARPLMLCAASADGTLYFYDLNSNALHPSLAVDANGARDAVAALCFNPMSKDYVATGDGKDGVVLWALGERLQDPLPAEHLYIERFAALALQDDG